MYETVRGEALQNLEPLSWALERVRQYGVAGLFPGSQKDFPFVLYTQSVPRPAWSGRRDFHREKLDQVYEFLIQGGDRKMREMRAVVYARVACATEQTKRATVSQLEALRDHAASSGMKIVEEFTDEGYSGLRLDRPGLDRIRDLAERRGFDVLLAGSPDRLARNFALQTLIIEELERCGVRTRSEEHTSELQSPVQLVCRLLLEKKNRSPVFW